MTGEHTLSDREIFKQALQWPSENRAAFLDEACGDNVELREDVVSLLLAHDAAESFMKRPALELSAELTVSFQSLTEEPGTVIGPYKLLQQIGEGGMGVVFMAEQTEPIQRTVALKIIKPGMDTRQVIARFEAERQALALMDHPNIAKVLDAGTTASGRPYFVMELVKGVPITQYCDEKHLPLRARLELLVPVCQAVQHAHQKGLIHRDIKPTNVLVAEYDNQAVPKVIDFGVAKATAQKLTERTMFTEFGQVLGTMEYMSPEQAKLNQLDVDTRSDVYSLGVLMYELLTGSTPFDRQRLHSAAFDEMLRIIREEEPPKPSTKLSTSEMLPSLAENRHSEPARLRREVRGELDWIVMKCLEKDRNRRYETANGLAADVEHFLRHEPVCACPPSVRYRVQKLAARNKGALAIGSSVLLLLTAMAAGVFWYLWDASARRAVLRSQVALALADTDEMQAQGNWPEALEAAQRAAAIVAGNQGGQELAQQAQQRIIDLQMALTLEDIHAGLLETRYHAGVRRGSPNDLSQAYATAFRDYGVDVLALDGPGAAAALNSRSIAQELAAALDHWALVQRQANENALARRLSGIARAIDDDSWRNRLRDVMEHPGPSQEERRKGLADPRKKAILELAQIAPIDALPPSTVAQLADVLGLATGTTGPSAQALDVLKRAQRNHPDDFRINFLLAQAYWRWDVVDEQVRFFTAATALRPGQPAAWSLLGEALQHDRRWEESIAVLRRAANIRATRGDGDSYSDSLLLGRALRFASRLEESAEELRRAIRLSPGVGDLHLELGTTLAAMNLSSDAADAYARAVDLGYDPYWNWRTGWLEIGRREDVFRRLTELQPANKGLWYIRGQYLVLARDWSAAMDAYDRVLRETSWPWASKYPSDRPFEYACLLLCAGDQERYTKFCQELIDRADDTNPSAQFVLARSCVILPQMIAPARQVVEWAESEVGANPSAWSLHVASLAHYRAGNFEKAIKLAHESNNWWWHAAARAPNWLVLALAHHRLGQAAQSKAALREAHRLASQAMGEDPLGNGVLAVAPPDWLEFEVLRREADDLMNANAVDGADGVTPVDAEKPRNRLADAPRAD